MSKIGERIPQCTFITSIKDGDNAHHMKAKTTDDFFSKKRAILFSVPGPYMPTCSMHHLPGFEKYYDRFKQQYGIDEIYCMSVSDTFTMNAWATQQCIEKVKMIPDGNGQFTYEMQMLVEKFNLGFGQRSWRYAAIINDGVIEAWFEEPGICDDCETDPYFESTPETVLQYFEETDSNRNNQT